MTDEIIIHEWMTITKKLISEGYDVESMQEYLATLPRPKMVGPKGKPKLVGK